MNIDRRGKNQRGIDNPNWKGEKVGYHGIHRWVETILGKPRYCEFCKSINEATYDWANISQEYKREIEDWMRLCRNCHMLSDKRINNLKFK